MINSHDFRVLEGPLTQDMNYDYKWVSGYQGIDWQNFNPRKNLVNHV
jgi:hypothetical protein